MAKRKSERVLAAERIRDLVREGMKEKPLLSRMELDVEGEKQSYGQRRMDEKLALLPPENDKPKTCPLCGKRARVRRRFVSRTFQSLSGMHTISRHYHYCEECKEGFFPVDDLLGLPKDGEFSDELEKRASDFVVNDVYESAERRWSMHYPFHASSNQFRQVAKRVGQMAEECNPSLLQNALLEPELEPSKTLYVMNDGGMVPMRGEWKEVKLATLFRSENHLKGQTSKRGQITRARYVAVLGDQEEFKAELREAIAVENMVQAMQAVWLADGAQGNWSLASLLFPQAIQILDWYHAIENAMKCGRVILGENDPGMDAWKNRIETLLINGGYETLMKELSECRTHSKNSAESGAIDSLIRYYENNSQRMNYQSYLRSGFLIGSGAVESAHRHVIQTRMKRAGQHWGTRGGRQMARLRAAYRTAGPERFHDSIRWAHRMTRRAARLMPKPHKPDLRRKAFRVA